MLKVLTPIQPLPEDFLDRARFFIMAHRLHPPLLYRGNVT
jgi:hypothetical protein